MSDDLIERMQESTYDPETREILDLGAFAHLAVADVCMARLRLEQAAAALVAKDAENARLREAIDATANRIEWNARLIANNNDMERGLDLADDTRAILSTQHKGETP